MTGPVTDPPPSGPGKDQLAELAEAVAAAAPRVTDDQRAILARIFAGGAR